MGSQNYQLLISQLNEQNLSCPGVIVIGGKCHGGMSWGNVIGRNSHGEK